MAGRTLSYYLEAFENMNRAVMRGVTAPHKPLLLLAILNLVQKRIIVSNHILLTKELIAEFKRLWLYYIGLQEGNCTIMVAEGLEMEVPGNYPFKCSIENPFYHMQHEPFWKLIQNSDAPVDGRKFYTSIKSLRLYYAYAEMDEELFELMMDVDAAGIIQQKLEEIM